MSAPAKAPTRRLLATYPTKVEAAFGAMMRKRHRGPYAVGAGALAGVAPVGDCSSDRSRSLPRLMAWPEPSPAPALQQEATTGVRHG